MARHACMLPVGPAGQGLLMGLCVTRASHVALDVQLGQGGKASPSQGQWAPKLVIGDSQLIEGPKRRSVFEGQRALQGQVMWAHGRHGGTMDTPSTVLPNTRHVPPVDCTPATARM
jgi:hypothetical protein